MLNLGIFMGLKHAFIYVALVIACWSILLRPMLYLSIEPMHSMQLGIQISNGYRAFLHANVYSLLTVLAYASSKRVARCNINWIFFLTCPLHCILNFVQNVYSMERQLLNKEMLLAENFNRMYVKIIMIFSMQLLTTLEVGFIVFYALQQTTKPVRSHT